MPRPEDYQEEVVNQAVKSQQKNQRLSPSFGKTLFENDFNAFTKSRKPVRPKIKRLDFTIDFPDIPAILQAIAGSAKAQQVIFIGYDSPPIFSAPHGVDGSISTINPYFSDSESIEATFRYYDFSKPTVFVLAGILEQMVDPRLLLRTVRMGLKLHSESVLVVATPDIKRTKNYDRKTMLPKDPSHVREWDMRHLTEFFISSCFTIEKTRHVRLHHSDESNSGSLLLLKASETNHIDTLKQLGLPDPKYTIVATTEHADTHFSGGIGAYLKEVEQNDPENKPIVLFCNPNRFESIMITPHRADNIVDIHDVIEDVSTEYSMEWHGLSTGVYRATRDLLYIYDQVGQVEYQEYLGIGAKLAEAKRTGEIPFGVTTVARCHGSQVYIDRAAFQWTGIEIGDVYELERMSLRYADIVSSPTKYLKDLYQSSGYEFDFNNSPILRLPYSYDNCPEVRHSTIKSVAFIGKRNKMKGFPDFCETVKEVTDPTNRRYCPTIKTVEVFGAAVEGSDKLENELKNILADRGIDYRMELLPREQLLSAIKERASNTLFLLPYGGDNHPVAVLEMIAHECPFIAYSNGGIPELLPDKYHDFFLVPVDQSWLAEKVTKMVHLAPTVIDKRLSSLLRDTKEQQTKINRAVSDAYSSGYPMSARQAKLYKPDKLGQLATIMVPCYNTDLKYVADLVDALNALYPAPHEVIFINDASTMRNYGHRLAVLLERSLRLPYRLITHERNLGLSGSRNTGLANCNTKYLINVDSDDTVGASIVYDYVKFLETHPQYSAISCGLEAFYDDESWFQINTSSDRYRYLGLGDCYVLGATKNVFGHAGSCVVVKAAKEIGGWDASDRSMWEDWAFYLKLVSFGAKIFNFPKINYYYRVNSNSMLRSYPEYPATLRLVRNLNCVNIWESERLFSYLREGTKLALSPPPSIVYVEREYNSVSFRAMKKIDNKIHSFFHKHPRTRRGLRFGLRQAGKVYRRLSHRG